MGGLPDAVADALDTGADLLGAGADLLDAGAMLDQSLQGLQGSESLNRNGCRYLLMVE